jgi:hypothetical protein
MSSLQIADQNQVIECPICYEEIDQLKNCVTTECGHQFHCSCLMKNSATNGFKCPMCRSTMAEEEDEDEDEDEEEDEEEEEIDDDNALASFRMFHQQLSGEEIEEEPLVDDLEEEEEEEPIIRPSATFIAAKLLTQGFTMKDLVNCLLLEHEEYDVELEANDRYSDQMFGKFRQIISNYPREMREQTEAEQGHQSSRQRARSEVETRVGCLQNRYHVLQDDDEEEDC